MPLSDFAYLNTYIFQSIKQILTLDNLEQDNLNKYKMHFLNSDFEFFLKGKKLSKPSWPHEKSMSLEQFFSYWEI